MKKNKLQIVTPFTNASFGDCAPHDCVSDGDNSNQNEIFCHEMRIFITAISDSAGFVIMKDAKSDFLTHEN